MGEFPQIFFEPILNEKEGDKIYNLLFTNNSNKDNVMVGFSKREFKNHIGGSGLKYYLIVMYFRKHLQTFGQITLSLDALLKECGYATKSHNQLVYSDFRTILNEQIINKGFASCDENVLSISPSKWFTIQLSEEKTLFFTKDNFVNFTVSEYEKITSIDSKVNRAAIAGVYLFIKQYIMDYGDENPNILQISYPSKQQIKDGIGISLSTVEKAITVLKNERLIYVRGDMYIQSSTNKKIFLPTRNVYSLKEEHLNGDFVLKELSKVYGKPVYNGCEIDGRSTYLKKQI